MYRIPIAMHNRLMRGEIPITYAVIDTHMGKRVYAEKEMTVTIASALEQSARVLSFGSFERTSQPVKDDILTAYTGKQIQHMSIELDNADRYFSRLIAKEPFLSRTLSIKVGFEAEAESTHISLFHGTITNINLIGTMTIEAEEEDELSSNITMKTTSAYISPLKKNVNLPIVYGDLAAGSQPQWACPCINTASFVYAFAGHAVAESAVWEVVADSAATDNIMGLVELNGKLYGGTSTVGNLLEWNGVDAWVQVAPQSGSNTIIYAMTVLNGKIYGVTEDGVLLEWNGTDAWASVAPTCFAALYCVTVMNGEIYAGCGGTAAGGILFRWNGTNAWVQESDTIAGFTYCLAIATLNDKIYCAGVDGKLYEWNGSDALVSVAAQTGSQTSIYSLLEKDGYIYAGTYPSGYLLRWTGTAWQVMSYSNGTETYITSLVAYNNEIYGGTRTHGMLLKWNELLTSSVTSWVLAAPQLTETIINAMAIFEGNLFAGTGTGGKLFKWNNNNVITVYSNNTLMAASTYTFDGSDDYEGQGAIAKLTFTATQGNNVITVNGKGKLLTGTTLMQNIIDQINDLLTVENDFTSALFDSTSKALAIQTFNSLGYRAAGAITEPRPYWDIITEMMSSFLGNAYINGSGNLVLEIDDGTVIQTGVTIIPYGEATIKDVTVKLSNIINQLPADYGYNYLLSSYNYNTDLAAQADTASQGVYGVRTPISSYQFMWCRDFASVQAMQDIIVGKLKNPLVEIEFENNNLKPVDLDLGSYFAMTANFLYDSIGSPLYNQIWKVISVKPDFSKGTITFRALQTPYYLLSGAVRDTTNY